MQRQGNVAHYNEYDSSTTSSKDKKTARKRVAQRGGPVKVIVNSQYHQQGAKRVKKDAKNLSLK